MADVFSKAKRSEVMSRIRSRGNQGTEVVLARLLRANGISGWRRHLQLRIANDDLRTGKMEKERLRIANKESRVKAAGRSQAIRNSKFGIRHFKVRPDFVFPKRRLAVFVDGCFWHGCPKHGTQPKGNAAFWKKKFTQNKSRDHLVNRALRKSGWQVLRIWEHELARKNEARLLQRIQRALT